VALITEWWKGFKGGTVPSPAMVKALLVNGATDMGTPDIPNNSEGWGRMNLGNVIDNGAAMIYHDQEHLFTASGETWTLSGSVADPTKPLKATLVWTDAPGMPGGNAWVNDLDLEVTVGGTAYKGNVFADGWSVAGGSADSRNNVENVYVQNPDQGVVRIQVTASNIAGDGVPYSGDDTDQDFALVVNNIVVEPDFTLSASPTSQEVCAPRVITFSVPVGSLVGYSETVTLSLGGMPTDTPYAFVPLTLTPPLTSTLFMTATGATPTGTHHLVITGTAETTRTHTATVDLAVSHAVPPAPTLLSPGSGASGVSLQPAFDWSAMAEATSYRIQVCPDALCTTPLIDAAGLTAPTYTATTDLMGGTCYLWRTDGRNSCGEGVWSDLHRFETIHLQLAFGDDIESGDGQWSHAADQGTDAWDITDAAAYSPSHAWFSPDVSTVTDDLLWNSVPFEVASGTTLTFWHRYNLEAYSSTEIGYDGGVIEISTNGGSTWSDLGPYITQSLYNRTISPIYDSPIAGRRAWSGDNGAWELVEVDLSSFAGPNVQVRWRLACDNSVAKQGWYVDDVRVITPLPPNGFTYEARVWVEAPAHFTATASSEYTYTWDFGGPGTGVDLGTATPTFTYTVPGDYAVQLTLENLCIAETITHEVSVRKRHWYYMPLFLKNS
jgi:PKD domain/Immune inhibitor A-like, MAM domain